MPRSTRDRARARFLDRHASWVPPGPRGKQIRSASRRSYLRADERAIGYVPYAAGELPDPLPATLVAFYLPQFHPTPENDEWWGTGFTEWRNVTRALPQFEGQLQPRLPGELGFYDLRNVNAMRRQSVLAREYGIGAFCFYFYWFAGKTLLEAPLRNWLAEASIDFPFCLCWANEKWTRTWDGRGSEVLIDQAHGPDDDIAFIRHISEYLRDPRYLRIGGKPLLLVYRPGLLPDAACTLDRWRVHCREHGIGELHIAYVQSFDRFDPRGHGFDSCVQFPPNLATGSSLADQQTLINPDFQGEVLDWRAMALEFQSAPVSDYVRHPGVNCGWDNQPRRPGKGRAYLHASPRRYRDWLAQAIGRCAPGKSAEERLVFINAWNEWAEGAVLEPDASLGHAYLAASRAALWSAAGTAPAAVTRQHVIVHAWYLAEFDEVLRALVGSGIDWHVVATTHAAIADEVRNRLSRCGLAFELLVGENRGRDILPFLKVANRLLDDGVEVVLKLHTKRSTHLENGDAWRRELLDRLVAGGRAQQAIDTFRRRSLLGIVAPEGHLISLSGHLGANAGTLDFLSVRLGLEKQDASASFVAGSMFWARLEALRPLLDGNLLESDFETEHGQLDGTLAHAVERIFTWVAADAGYEVACADAPDLTAVPDSSTEYAYLP